MRTAVLRINSLRPAGKLSAGMIENTDLVVITDDDLLRSIPVDVYSIDMIRES